MVKRKLLAAAGLVLCFSLPAAAADYFFKVNELKARLIVRTDGLVELRYAVTFTPQPGSHPVDIVDIGMPNEHYELATARAAIAGAALSDIRDSEYVKPGVEVHLGAAQIAPGASGTMEFSILLSRLVFPDSADAGYAALQFKTTWYDAKYVAGNAERIEVQFDLPPGSTPETVKYHDFGGGYRPSEMQVEGDHVVYRWLWLERPATLPYAAGASFPRRLVAAVYSPPKRSVLKGLLEVFFALIAFVFSLSPVWIIVLLIVLAVRSGRRRRQQYLPPRVGIESGGIKRGLAPPEAALLQELPLAKVLLLVIFGLLKKERLSISEPAAKDFRFREQPREGAELQDYETSFIAAIDKENRLDKALLRRMFTEMIAALQKKMAGFSRRETNAYYQSIMNKAWEQVKACPSAKLPQELAESLEWLALDPEYEKKLEPYAQDGVFLPGGGGFWYRNFPQRSPGSGGAPVPDKGFGQGVGGAASRLVGSLQAFSGALLGDSAAFTAAITQVTNPPPVRTYGGSGGHSGGGSGCACACACACAGCACACAGGGR
jgi:hypothetical protein